MIIPVDGALGWDESVPVTKPGLPGLTDGVENEGKRTPVTNLVATNCTDLKQLKCTTIYVDLTRVTISGYSLTNICHNIQIGSLVASHIVI